MWQWPAWPWRCLLTLRLEWSCSACSVAYWPGFCPAIFLALEPLLRHILTSANLHSMSATAQQMTRQKIGLVVLLPQLPHL